ncbi:Fungal specific transcription factor domain-containing protein [Cladophialophora immunda]|nr:Fungal specific transcription factor domain-containing protein [Cladophialophora immunda]
MVAGLKSLSIFHQPSFPDKIRGIQDRNHLIALFAAMFSLSSRLATEDKLPPGDNSESISHQELHSLSLQYINSSLEACTSNAPPLCILQAITLAGFYKLVNGVYGPAWRLVGTGVRIAYELRLHLIDCKGYEKVPTRDSELMMWSSDEERRRCWWALWEMDIFASTIQRAPTAIDWSANETFLPVADEYWFTNTYQASCLLLGSPEERWKRLKHSGNENSAAWAYLLASLMHEGRLLCQERIKGITSNADLPNDVPKLAQYYSQDYRLKAQGFSDRLSSLVKAYQDVRENLPTALAYRGEYLSFALGEGDDPYATRRTSAGKYSIHMMSASACFMIYQNYVFADIIEGLIPLPSSQTSHEYSGRDTELNERSFLGKGFRNYLEASDMVLRLLSNCPEDHVRYVNPYYASTTWIAAALQVFKRFTLRDHDSTLTQRQYDLLRRSYLQFNQFWETPRALLQNLDSLQARLDSRHRELELQERSSSARDTQIDGQPCHGDTQSFASTETIMASMCGEQLLPDWSGLKGSLCNTSQPSVGDPNTSYPALLPEDVELPSGIAPKFHPSLGEAAFAEPYPDPWPNELFLDNLVWYSSDVMAGLSHGYTA